MNAQPMVTIYDAEGLPIKTLSLKELIGNRETWEFPADGDHHFLGQAEPHRHKRQCLVLDIWESGDPYPFSRQDSCKYESLEISLKDGRVQPENTK